MYRIIGGVSHRIQYPPKQLEIFSREELISEIRALVQIINSGRLHNQKQIKLISDLEDHLKVSTAEKESLRTFRYSEGTRIVQAAVERGEVIEVEPDTSPLPPPPQLG